MGFCYRHRIHQGPSRLKAPIETEVLAARSALGRSLHAWVARQAVEALSLDAKAL